MSSVDTVTMPRVAAEDMRQLALSMGRVIRSMDDAGDHAEVWTNDGEYIPNPQYQQFADALDTP